MGIKSKIAHLVCIMLICCSLWGCKADINLSDVDWSTSIKASIALPVGSISAKIGDFLGSSPIPQVTVDSTGRYIYKDTITSTNQYHPIDLTALVTNTRSRWNVADEVGKIFTQLQNNNPLIIQALKFFYPDFKDFNSIPLPITLPVEYYIQYFKGSPLVFDLEFPIDLDLKQLNVDFDYQRVDSIIVDIAHFTSIYTVDSLDLQWGDIKSVEILLSDNFRQIDSVLTLPIEGKDFGQALPIDLRDFHLVLMKDPDAESSGDNIVDAVNLKIRFKIELAHDLTIKENQYIGYDFHVDILDYGAMFGYFAADSLMHDEMINTPITEMWAGWEFFENWVLPVSEPSVKFEIDHTLGLPMTVNLHNLSVESKNGDTRCATFDAAHQQTSTTLLLPNKIAMDAPLDYRAHDTIVLDYSDERGNIDTLFSISPQNISYAFTVNTDNTSDDKQFRITDNTDINMKLMIEVPFTFNNGVQIIYHDTIDSLHITETLLDSLYRETELVEDVPEVELQLIAVIENYIPFAIEGEFTLYDANNQVVQLSQLRDEANGTQDSSIRLSIPCPENIVNKVVVEPSTTTLSLLTIHEEDFELFESVEYITFTAKLGNNQHTVDLTPEASVCIKLGIAANVEAVIDLEEIF